MSVETGTLSSWEVLHQLIPSARILIASSRRKILFGLPIDFPLILAVLIAETMRNWNNRCGDADESGFDIDAAVEGSLDLPSLLEPALTLRDLDRAIQIARPRPPRWTPGHSITPGSSYGLGLPGGAPKRGFLNRHPQLDPVVGRVNQILLGAEVSLCSLD